MRTLTEGAPTATASFISTSASQSNKLDALALYCIFQMLIRTTLKSSINWKIFTLTSLGAEYFLRFPFVALWAGRKCSLMPTEIPRLHFGEIKRFIAASREQRIKESMIRPKVFVNTFSFKYESSDHYHPAAWSSNFAFKIPPPWDHSLCFSFIQRISVGEFFWELDDGQQNLMGEFIVRWNCEKVKIIIWKCLFIVDFLI